MKGMSTQINSTQGISNTTKDLMATNDITFPRMLNTLFLFAFFGSFLSLGIMAYLIRSSAIFFFVAVILITVFAFVSAILSNTYGEFVADYPELSDHIAENYSFLNHIINNYVLYVVVMSFLVLIALYAKIGGNVGTGI